jgi:hypothetical protein
MDTHPITAEVQRDPAGTHNTDTKVHHDPLKDADGGDKTRAVSHISRLCTPQSTRLPSLSLMLG